ncbi:MAG: hypothetical protein EBZ49_06835 [Proteobacteria bacterium]|nr:hypothetical protein [Pseudomonadota bacterium]
MESKFPLRFLQLTSMIVFILCCLGISAHLIINPGRKAQEREVRKMIKQCSNSHGILIRGANKTSVDIATFSVCVPREAFTCIDPE